MGTRKLPKEALEFFRKQGQRGGKARLDTLTPERRKQIARKAAAARWGKKPPKTQ